MLLGSDFRTIRRRENDIYIINYWVVIRVNFIVFYFFLFYFICDDVRK